MLCVKENENQGEGMMITSSSFRDKSKKYSLIDSPNFNWVKVSTIVYNIQFTHINYFILLTVVGGRHIININI